MKPESYIPTILRGAARFAWKHAPILDFCLVTGDLATTGLQSDLRVARQFVNQPTIDRYYVDETETSLQGMQKPLYVVPGNHDTYRDDDGHPSGSAHFRMHFPNQLKNFRENVGHTVRAKGNEKLAIVFVDFSLRQASDISGIAGVKGGPAALLRFGQGRVYDDILTAFSSRVLELRQKYSRLPIVAAVHFAPFDCGIGLRLNDYKKFVDLVSRLNVPVVLCGHTHEHGITSSGNSLIFCAGATGSADCRENSYLHVYEFDVAGGDVGASRQNFSWSWEQHSFIPDKTERVVGKGI